MRGLLLQTWRKLIQIKLLEINRESIKTIENEAMDFILGCYVQNAMVISDEQIDSSVRISIYNTEDDVRTMVKWIIKYHNIATLTEA